MKDNESGRFPDELIVVYRETVDEFYESVSPRSGGSRELAEDVTQETYPRATTAWPRSGLPDWPLAWLQTVARSLLLNHYRRRPPGRMLFAVAAERAKEWTVEVVVVPPGSEISPDREPASPAVLTPRYSLFDIRHSRSLRRTEFRPPAPPRLSHRLPLPPPLHRSSLRLHPSGSPTDHPSRY